ncbi:hypothetical protein [Bacteroides propionicifaciens]|jgi:hypothetical protein|uniref:hypothetical protein n=1 Tax=Bacteroides propionicifaciens TaxID=392838 RepID=UPI00036D48BE|nr:hypothetical protein [Bacteroides propionicifaciens]
MLTFNQFEVGDIVKIKRTPSQSNPFKSEGRELYKIADICGNEIKLDWELEAYSIKEISPIIIDRKEDSIIHLNHKKSAHSFILAGMQEPRESNLREYYLDTAHKLGWVKLLELIRAKDILYVNQVQRYLQNYFNGYTLEFDA